MSLEDIGAFVGMIGGPLPLCFIIPPELRTTAEDYSFGFVAVFGPVTAFSGFTIGKYVGRFLDDYILFPIQNRIRERREAKEKNLYF